MPRLDAGAATTLHAFCRDARAGEPARETGAPPERVATLSPAKRPPETSPADEGGALFLVASRRDEAAAALQMRRWIVAKVSEETSAGKLGAALDDAVEAALALRGAVPPAVDVDADAESTLRDRLLRVRALDRPGLAVLLPRLARLADQEDRLDAADSAALMTWIDASARAPVALLFDEADRSVRALAPVELSQLVDGPPEMSAPDAPRAVAPSQSCDPTPSALPFATVLDAGPADIDATRATLPGIAAEDDAPTPLVPAVHIHEPDDDEDLLDPQDEEPTQALVAPLVAPPSPAAAAPAPPGRAAERLPATPLHAAKAAHPSEEAAPTAAQRVVSAAEWRTLAVELDAARGPKPARQIDRLFVTRYQPLLAAVARGEVDATVRGIVEAWRQSFEHSYKDGFAALRLTGKRPPMVLDAPEIAAKLGRLNGARSVKLLLVDAMGFDLGERVMARLGRELTGRALCVERLLLWSALPSTTPMQMSLLARGPDGLRDAPPTSEREPDISRGRALTTLRRERIGARELLKLDVVEARLRSSGPGYDERLDAIADEVAPVVARCAATLPPRTLLFVFGDHGFRLPASADGRSTGPATQGEASPEEIIVPGYALLTGGVH
jgi:hypothetical protein